MTESIWMLHAKKADFDGLAARFDISPVTARIIRNRDIEDEAAFDRYLNGSLEDLYSPGLLPDMEEAVRRIRRAVKEKRRLRIVGDYDIDGVCATAVLYKGFARIGADADYVIPERIRDGYGINEQIIEAAAADGIETLVTCDNGIAAISQIARAKELGLEVIITDHHDIQTDGETGADLMPPADAIVNPKRRDSRYPWPEICGAMVAFKLIGALYDSYGIDRQEWLELLEFAAVATVGDVMKLKDENRIVVKEGLKRLACTGNPGLKSLILKNAIDPANISAYHIGFVLGPCLNASGRLQTAELAVELLLCGDPARADEIAEELKELNDKRKAMTQENVEAAADQVEKELSRDKVLVIFLPDCHESLAGIVAGRIRERYNKPVFVLTRAEGCAKGSGRSIEAYHMFHALVEVKDLLLKFGGHPMAAGFSLEESDIGEFRRRLNENAEDRLTEDDFIPRVWIDAAMPFEYVTEELIGDLERLEPFGQGNEKPQFAQKSMTVRSVRVMGRNRNVVRLSLANERGFSMDGIIFGDGDAFLEEMGRRRGIDIIYYPTVNEYNGNRTLQVVVKAWKFRD
ncbi:single-stranded-DNA-specific exonuclease RecJ [Enterocloster alcoholdehydrogenati]|uniref:single-stranded-DNA-specific exonuclease RecJ n=1 Tax=Enterocloster alcoholdehydrogenati TaxID=2547410 RepID=UPI001592C04F|nr:single-stranded-DNA-specific exonuclease RecJ [Enterocloster alcoholdehydrogenati]